MSVKDQVQSDLKEAMKAGDSEKLSVLRMLSAAFSNAEIEARGKGEMGDADYVQVIKKEVKKRNEAALAFKENGREESAANEAKEAEMLSVYLPEEMSEDQVQAVVDAVVAEMGTDNMGMIIGEVKNRTNGEADGGMIARLVKAKLG
ncbi:MAG: GatB/YqeY domain-containing protein [Patescibacteria group bacterium]